MKHKELLSKSFDLEGKYGKLILEKLFQRGIYLLSTYRQLTNNFQHTISFKDYYSDVHKKYGRNTHLTILNIMGEVRLIFGGLGLGSEELLSILNSSSKYRVEKFEVRGGDVSA